MSKSKSDPDLEKQLQFLYSSALLYQSTSPSLSRHFITRYIVLSLNQKIPFTNQKTYCHCCGSLFTDSNTTVTKVEKVDVKTILVNTKPLGNDKVVEHVLTKCHVCQKYTQFYSLLKSERDKMDRDKEKKGVGKKKKVTLAGLVSKKSQEGQQGYSMTDFISDL